jgi:hypothetical protein
MKIRFLSSLLLLALYGVSFNTLADDHKVVLCHKDKNSISVGAAGLSAHLGHGDTEGPCGEVVEPEPEDPSRMVTALMMHCTAVAGEGVNVVTFSSSVELDETDMPDGNCADALANLLNGQWDFKLRSVTGSGESGTDYLLLGEADAETP